MNSAKRLVSACILAAFALVRAVSQVADFSAAHIPGSQDVEITFRIVDSPVTSGLELPVFSLSVDGGHTYQESVTTFDPAASPTGGVQKGLNRFVWKAGKDHPNRYVDPSFLRMRLGLVRDTTPTFQYQNTGKPALKVNRTVPAFEAVRHVAGAARAELFSSSEALVGPGTFVGNDLRDLVRQLDPNSWSPPKAGDLVSAFPSTPVVQDGNPSPTSPPGSLKIDAGEDVDPGLPEVKPGQSKVFPENPITTKAVELKDDEPAELPIAVQGSSLFVQFDVFQDEVRFAGVLPVSGRYGSNFRPVSSVYSSSEEPLESSGLPVQNPSQLPREPGKSLAAERGTIWAPGDYLVGCYDSLRLIDLKVLDDPHWQHVSSGDEHHNQHYLMRGSLGATFDDVPDLSRIVVWRARFSNVDAPLEDLKQFDKYLSGYLKESLQVTKAQLKAAGAVANARRATARRAPTNAPLTVRDVWRAGPLDGKYNVVVTGEGFADTPADNSKIGNWLTNKFLNGFVTGDLQPSYFNSINVLFMDAKSRQSGMSQTHVITNVPSVPPEQLNRLTGLTNYLARYEKSRIVTNGITNVIYEVHLLTNRLDTAWGVVASDWDACWRHLPPEGWSNVVTAATTALGRVPDEVWVIGNTPNGGCSSAWNGVKVIYQAEGNDWQILAHEFGHSFSGLSDEYTKENSYPPPNKAPLSSSTQNLLLASAWDGTYAGLPADWRDWLPAWRPIPTSPTNGVHYASSFADLGLFLGGYYSTNGVYRPSFDNRMNGNYRPHSPVGVTESLRKAGNYRRHDLRKNLVLDANGDGFADVVLHDGRMLALYLSTNRNVGTADPVSGTPPRAVTGVLEPTQYLTDRIKNVVPSLSSWRIRHYDQFTPCDFDGDGREDLIAYNDRSWGNPLMGLIRSTGTGFETLRRWGRLDGFQFRAGDRIQSADFDGDGHADWMTIFNGTGWEQPLLAVYRIDASGRAQFVRRFDQFLPGWAMGPHERLEFVDINGDGADDIVAINQVDWSKVHIHTYLSQRDGNFVLGERGFGTFSANSWKIARNDRYFFGDWNGDGTKDLGVFNGLTWDSEYVILFAFDRSGKARYLNHHRDKLSAGWNLQPHDEFQPLDRNGDGLTDLVVFNATDWGDASFLGIASNDGKGRLSANWQKNYIGGWRLKAGDRMKAVDWRGDGGLDDLFIFNSEWFGGLRGLGSSFGVEMIYHRWIDNYRYHASGLY